MTIEVRTKAQFEAALKIPNSIIDILEGIYELVTYGSEAPFIRLFGKAELTVEARGSSQPRVEAWGSSQPRVEAWGSSQPRVVAWESSQPRVEAWGSSQPRVEAWESSQPRVVAWESSQPRVEASGFVQLSLLGKIVAKAAAKVAVLIEGDGPKVTGGKQIRRQLFKNGKGWCEYYGVPVKAGKAIVFKALDKDLRSSHGLVYPVGATVKSDGWNKNECDQGLHFIPTPKMGYEFAPEAERFVACEVAVKDMLVFSTGSYPNKAKAPECKVLYECNDDGEEIKK